MFYWNTVGEEFQIESVYSLTEKKDYSRLCMWTISNWLDPMGCTQRECQTSKEIVDIFRNMFESKISAGATEKAILL